YRRSKKEPGTLVVAITQSGETADTLAAMRDSKAKGLPTMALCNGVGSTATREADYVLMTHCGPEIGVASTKAFTGQLTALFLLSLHLAYVRGVVNANDGRVWLERFVSLPKYVEHILKREAEIVAIAKRYHTKRNFLYL